MKKTLFVLLFCSVSFSDVLKNIDVGAPRVENGELTVGSSLFKSGFYVLDERAKPVTSARVQVDPGTKSISIKWYNLNLLVQPNPNLKHMLSTRDLQLPAAQISSPLLSLASGFSARNPFLRKKWSLSKTPVQILKDPYTPTHEERYLCIKEKNGCFRVDSNSNVPDLKISLHSNSGGTTLSFVTNYEYLKGEEYLNLPCTPSESDGVYIGNKFYPRCKFSKPTREKYQTVTLNKFDEVLAYINYKNNLSDIITSTLEAYSYVLKNMNTFLAATRECHYSISMQVGNRLTSQLIEDIQGQGTDADCFKTQLSALRIQFAPEQLVGLNFSAEQRQLADLINGIETNCPFEVWVGPRNRYTLYKKECVQAGIYRLEAKARQIQGEILRFLN